ncbi:MAG: hypothetical protein M1837_000863 [Sclerophora amabilis]|nr:MAG: hypothetical protein M1837_000863 [Sclerophora amabilis]
MEDPSQPPFNLLDASQGVVCITSHPFDASYAPPITHIKLLELDFDRLISNRQMRHDINFNPNLTYSPNIEGETSETQKRQADTFWALLEQEFNTCFASDVDGKPNSFHNCQRIRQVLSEIQNILCTLVPERDMELVQEMLDAELIMQQIQQRILDYPLLASNIARMIHQHCAPMRDQLVQKMVHQIGQGAMEKDVAALVLGVRDLFAVLEAMKLDVANHQIKSLRTLLVADTVTFEQDYFLGRMRQRRFDVDGSCKWYTRNQRIWGLHERPMTIFVRAMVGMMLPSNELDRPDTFEFDIGQIDMLRSELVIDLALKVCSDVLTSVAYVDHDYRSTILTGNVEALHHAIRSLLGDGNPRRRLLENIDSIAIEIGRCLEPLPNRNHGARQVIISKITRELRAGLAMDSGLWQYHEVIAREHIWRDTLSRMEHFTGLSIVAVANAASDKSPAEDRQDYSHISSLLAHLGTIHWRVWSKVLYEEHHYLTLQSEGERRLGTKRVRTGFALGAMARHVRPRH